jgi:hypothetical protein
MDNRNWLLQLAANERARLAAFTQRIGRQAPDTDGAGDDETAVAPLSFGAVLRAQLDQARQPKRTRVDVVTRKVTK